MGINILQSQAAEVWMGQNSFSSNWDYSRSPVESDGNQLLGKCNLLKIWTSATVDPLQSVQLWNIFCLQNARKILRVSERTAFPKESATAENKLALSEGDCFC